MQLRARQSASLLQWFCPPTRSAALARGHWEHQALRALHGLFLVSVHQIIKLSQPRYQEATDNNTHSSRLLPAVWLHLQHLLLIDVMFSDITSWIKCIIYTCTPSPPWLQDDDHIFRFYTTGFHFEFWLKACWKKGVLQAYCTFITSLPFSAGVQMFVSTCLEKSYQAKRRGMLCSSVELQSNFMKQILTLICHSSTSLSLRLLASSRSAILAVYSASSVACWIIKLEL